MQYYQIFPVKGHQLTSWVVILMLSLENFHHSSIVTSCEKKNFIYNVNYIYLFDKSL